MTMEKDYPLSRRRYHPVSLLPYKHVLPNGTYFVDDAVEAYGDFVQKVTV